MKREVSKYPYFVSGGDLFWRRLLNKRQLCDKLGTRQWNFLLTEKDDPQAPQASWSVNVYSKTENLNVTPVLVLLGDFTVLICDAKGKTFSARFENCDQARLFVHLFLRQPNQRKHEELMCISPKCYDYWDAYVVSDVLNGKDKLKCGDMKFRFKKPTC